MLIDSNILIYAINSRSPKHKRAQNFLQDKTNPKFFVAQQNILEALRVLTHPRFEKPMPSARAIEAIDSIIKSCNIIGPDYKTHLVTFELIKKYNLSSDLIFDAFLVATAFGNGVKEIATDNEKDFKKLGISVFNPFSEK